MKGKDQSDSDVRASQEEARAQEQRSAIALAERIAEGDRAAEQQLVERYSRPLLFMLKRRCGDPELANDLHQEVFSVVLQRLRAGTIKDPARLAGFIQSTGRNLLIGVIRRRQRRQTYADSDSVAIAADEDRQDQYGEINAEQVAENVRTMLDELGSERDRAILTRFYLQQEDKQSICSALELSDLHFNRVLYRAKKRFRELLQKSDRDIARDLSEGRGE
ncbi:MAG: sigma-70 family RNA polymerase sigma factor [Pseudomonadota bacterium]